ncbi:hypothetical protein PtA15_7A40 [Puccinia triticina]|nr:uncharacterized protein PtA15_7A40 [Puccinia triticina]WAQ86314.1 hypothetical protein PtA15_7A40 [Puccinia triticina]
MVTNLTLTAEKFESCFESSVLLIAFYIVPLIPDTNGFPTQKYYQSWLTTWHLQLSLAMQNLRAAAKLFGNIA